LNKEFGAISSLKKQNLCLSKKDFSPNDSEVRFSLSRSDHNTELAELFFKFSLEKNLILMVRNKQRLKFTDFNDKNKDFTFNANATILKIGLEKSKLSINITNNNRNTLRETSSFSVNNNVLIKSAIRCGGVLKDTNNRSGCSEVDVWMILGILMIVVIVI
jgi:hypothetical protein